jgi:site-specific DNA-methyltransferase (cytosine-N4-specific)
MLAYEPVLIFCNDPVGCVADDGRVLQPHSKRHAQLLAAGGEVRTATYGDGSYTLRPGSFGNVTAGKIPKNVISVTHVRREVEKTRKEAKAVGLPTHGALMPVKLGKLLVEFLTHRADWCWIPSVAGAPRQWLARRPATAGWRWK